MNGVAELANRLALALRLDPEAWRAEPFFTDVALEFAAGNEQSFSEFGLDEMAIAALRHEAARVSGHLPRTTDAAPIHSHPESDFPSARTGVEAGANTDHARGSVVEIQAALVCADGSTDGDGDDSNAEFRPDRGDITVQVLQSIEADPTGRQLLEDGLLLDAIARLCFGNRQKYQLIVLTLKGGKLFTTVEPAVRERVASLREGARERGRQRKLHDAEAERQHREDEKRAQAEEKGQRAHEANARRATGPQYDADGDGLFRVHQDRDGHLVRQPLTSFSARLMAALDYRDDPMARVVYEIEWQLDLRSGRCTVAAAEFDELRWVAARLPSDAIVYPKSSTDVACAIRFISGPIPTHVVHQTTGWVDHNGVPVYCHGGGGIGPRGVVDDIRVELRPELKAFTMPEPPRGRERIDAMRSLLTILMVAPLRVSLPLFSMLARAAIGDPNAVLWFAGGSGRMKSSFAALAQSCCGASMCTDDKLPLGFDSTANAIEATLWTLKDSIVVVDDLAPDGGRQDRERRHAAASRLIRSTANRRGRTRMMREGVGTYEVKPRALLIFTGEETPEGFSIGARMLRVEVEKGDIATEQLDHAQALAKNGTFARGYAAYIEALAGDLKTRQLDHRERTLRLRSVLQKVAPHSRIGSLLADLMAGLEVWLLCALRMRAITRAESIALREQWTAEVVALARTQAAHVEAENPVRVFLEALLAGLGSTRMHLTDQDGDRPADAEKWGWLRDRAEYHARGDRIGFVESGFLYLEPTAAYAATSRYLQDSQRSLPVSGSARYGRELVSAGLLAGRKDRGTVRRTVGGTRATFWKIEIKVLDEYLFGTADSDGSAATQDEFSDADSQGPLDGAPGGPNEATGSVGTAGDATPERDPGDDDPDDTGWPGGRR